MPITRDPDRSRRRVNLTDYAVLHAPTQANLMRSGGRGLPVVNAQARFPVGTRLSEADLRRMAPNVRADWPGWAGVSGVVTRGGGGNVSPAAPNVINIGQNSLTAGPSAIEGTVSHELSHVRDFANPIYRANDIINRIALVGIDKVFGTNLQARYNFAANERKANLVGGGYGNPNAPSINFGGYRTLNAMPPGMRPRFQNFLVPGAPRQRGGK